MLKVYPKIEVEKVVLEYSIVLTLSTLVRKKHDKGFYYLVHVKSVSNYNAASEDTECVIHNLYQIFLKEIDQVKTSYIYQDHKNFRHLNPIDRYQGDDLNQINYNYLFKYYQPEFSYEELVELNNYMLEK
jgi:hypothetical protein